MNANASGTPPKYASTPEAVETTLRSPLSGRLMSTACARNAPNTAPINAVASEISKLDVNATRYCGCVTVATRFSSVGMPDGSDSAPLTTKYSGPPRKSSR